VECARAYYAILVSTIVRIAGISSASVIVVFTFYGSSRRTIWLGARYMEVFTNPVVRNVVIIRRDEKERKTQVVREYRHSNRS